MSGDLLGIGMKLSSHYPVCIQILLPINENNTLQNKEKIEKNP